jgi:hypothetical protein
VFTVWFSRVRDIEKFLAAHGPVKPVHSVFTIFSAVFTGTESFSNPGKDDARKAASHLFVAILQRVFQAIN